MSRTTIEVPMKTNNVDEVLRIVATTVEPSGYKQKIVDGETVWSKGDGVIMQMQCFGVTFSDRAVLIQGWMKDSVIGESALEGFFAKLPKRKMKKLLDHIQSVIIAKNL